MNREQLLATIALIAIFALVGWSYWSGGIIGVLLDPELDAATKVESLRAFFNGWGPFAPLVYILLIVIEVVVAPIPGAILYMPGGVIFGGFLGRHTLTYRQRRRGRYLLRPDANDCRAKLEPRLLQCRASPERQGVHPTAWGSEHLSVAGQPSDLFGHRLLRGGPHSDAHVDPHDRNDDRDGPALLHPVVPVVGVVRRLSLATVAAVGGMRHIRRSRRHGDLETTRSTDGRKLRVMSRELWVKTDNQHLSLTTGHFPSHRT